MPAYSSIKTFIQSLRTGETNITITLARAVAAEGVDNIRDPASVNPHLSNWLRGVLAAHGMRPAEITHVDNWPPAKKEEARAWVVAAVDASRSVAFAWELFGGDDPANRRDDPGAPQPVSITFRSPRRGVRLSGLNYGQVHVDQ